MKTVLFINYYFPPLGGVGVQRALKLTKYLGQFGWRVINLTVKDINYHLYQPALLKQVPSNSRIIRTDSLDPLRLSLLLRRTRGSATSGDATVRNERFGEGSKALLLYRSIRDIAFLPDATAGWIPFAWRAGVKAAKEERIDAIVAFPHPTSAGLIAAKISKETGIPYAVDLRDGWWDDPNLPKPTSFHSKMQLRMEKYCLMGAAGVSVFGDWLGDRLKNRYPHLTPNLLVLPNGYDPEDLAGAEAAPAPSGRRRIVHAGSLYMYRKPIFAAFLQSCALLPSELRYRLEFAFVGQSFAGAQELIDSMELGSTVKLLGFRAHRETIGLLKGADASLLLVDQGDMRTTTGKLCEYIGIPTPIIAWAEPAGEAAKALRQAGRDRWLCPPLNTGGMAQMIEELNHLGWPRQSVDEGRMFNRIVQAEQFGAFLDRVAL